MKVTVIITVLVLMAVLTIGHVEVGELHHVNIERQLGSSPLDQANTVVKKSKDFCFRGRNTWRRSVVCKLNTAERRL
jgi:hypothetical protein